SRSSGQCLHADRRTSSGQVGLGQTSSHSCVRAQVTLPYLQHFTHTHTHTHAHTHYRLITTGDCGVSRLVSVLLSSASLSLSLLLSFTKHICKFTPFWCLSTSHQSTNIRLDKDF